MVMAVKLVHHQPSNSIVLLAGYEGGVTAAFKLPRSSVDSGAESARLLYLSKPHDQPILSLDASPDGKEYFTSSADAKIAMHRIPELPPDMCEEVQHGMDNQSRLASKKQSSPQEELAQARKLHQRSDAQEDVGMADASSQHFDLPNSPLSFTKQMVGPSQQNIPRSSGLSSLLSSAEPQANIQPAQLPPPVVTVQPPYKMTDTKHAGQQSLRVRSDGRLVVTGGWDARVRIYSAKTLKEVAVLKWHKEGVYAVAVGDILESSELRHVGRTPRMMGEWAKFQQMREAKDMLTHRVAAGAKDGKVSLWEVF
jgi:WD40 repeat protein